MILFTKLREHQRWFLAGCVVVGVAVSMLPFLSEPNGNMAIVPYLTTWFACGVAAGLLVPDRPWRWGVAIAVGQPIAGILFNPEMALVTLVTIPLLPVVAAPIVIGAYLGMLVSPARMAMPVAPIVSRPAAISSRLFLLSGAGLLAGALPVFFVPETLPGMLFVWMGVAAAVAVTSVTWARSGIVKGTAIATGVVIGAFMTAVIYDTAAGGPDHNLLPFEMLYVVVATSVPAAVLASVARVVVRMRVERS